MSSTRGWAGRAMSGARIISGGCATAFARAGCRPARGSSRWGSRRSGKPRESSCLTLVWAVLDLYMTHATNGIKFTQLERQRLKRMRYEGHEQTTPEEVSAA